MRKLIRRLLRRLSRGRILRKRLPASHGGGVLYCSPEALLSMWKPGWRAQQAQGLLAWTTRYVDPGMRVWDLGANQGIFSFAAAARSGPTGEVLALEPDPFLLNLLYMSHASGTHRGAPVHVLPVAVADTLRIAEFEIAQTDRALNHLSDAAGNPHAGPARARHRVACVTLDWLATQLPPPDLLKIDVEGAELLAMRGACELLQQHRPVLIVETAPENTGEMSRLLAEQDYVLFDANGPLDQPVPAPCWNTLAWPREKLAEVEVCRQRVAMERRA